MTVEGFTSVYSSPYLGFSVCRLTAPRFNIAIAAPGPVAMWKANAHRSGCKP